MPDQRFRHAFLILLVAAVSAAFLAMIWTFALTILLAAIFAGLAYPVYAGMARRFGGRDGLAAATTLVMMLLLVLVPLVAVLAAGANEALRMTEEFGPRLKDTLSDSGALEERLRGLPGYALIEPYRDQILSRATQVVGATGTFLVSALSATTVATAVFVFHLVVLLYTMFFFLIDGPALLRACVSYMPLADADKAMLLERFVSVTRATLKGTVFIGVIQGFLSGFAFWVAGIEGAIFWGTVMTVLSIVPGLGGALVWVPAVIIWALLGHVAAAAALAAFCGLVVGTVDNILRPRLVGRDTQMHTLLIFVSTLGGLSLFGATGFILGPVLAALFVTAWEMFGVAFRRELAEPATPPLLADPDPSPEPTPGAEI
jgi:predicted PurR-regulated permease PerM